MYSFGAVRGYAEMYGLPGCAAGGGGGGEGDEDEELVKHWVPR